MNKVIFLGRLTAEPRRKFVGDSAVVNFGIAVPNRFRKSGQTADFFECEAWNKDAENIFKYFHKGDGILVCGRMENFSYISREGQRVNGVILKVEEWDFGQKKQNRDTQNYQGTAIQDSGFEEGFNKFPDE